MSQPSELLAQLMRAYPILYPEPLDVAIDVLTGSAFHWEGGELVHSFTQPANKSGQDMDVSDLEEREDELKRHEGPSSYTARDHAERLKIYIAQEQRRIIDNKVELMAEAGWAQTYFRDDFYLSATQRGLVRGEREFSEEAPLLFFPDDIKPAWGQVLQDMHDWFQTRLRSEFGMTISGGNAHWPEKAQELYARIELARERLFPLLNDGLSWAEHQRQCNDMAEQIIQNMLDEDNALENAETPLSTKPRRPGR